jgi:hypothetical protein
MAERSMAEVMQEIGPLLDDFDEICRQAFTIYRAYDPAVLVEHDPRAAAACIYAHMAAGAERRFSDHALIKPVDSRPLGGLKVWRVGQAALIRFKKHDEDGRSRNYPTKQAKAYDRGDNTLPGLEPPAARLSVGYWLDPSNTVFLRTQVARPLGKSIDWNAAIVPAPERAEGGQRWIDVTRQGRGW